MGEAENLLFSGEGGLCGKPETYYYYGGLALKRIGSMLVVLFMLGCLTACSLAGSSEVPSETETVASETEISDETEISAFETEDGASETVGAAPESEVSVSEVHAIDPEADIRLRRLTDPILHCLRH